jgi:hypothetical protein
MLLILQKEFNALHKNGGKPPKLTPEDKLSIALKYLREYRTMDSIAVEYSVCKGTVCPGNPIYHANSFLLIKASKKRQLTQEEKAYNKKIGGRACGD